MKSSLEIGIRACQAGDFQQAIAILEVATQVAASDPVVWLALARAFRGAGEYPKAIAAYQFVLGLRPPNDVMEEAERELTAVNHNAKAAITEIMRPLCEACGAQLPGVRAARPWCLCGWNTRTPPVIGRQLFLSDVYAYAASRAVSLTFRRHEDVYVVARGRLGLHGLGTKIHEVDARLALPCQNRLPVIFQDELLPIGADNNEGFFRVRSLSSTASSTRAFSWRQFVAHVSEVGGLDVSVRSPDTSMGAVLFLGGLLSTEALGQATTLRQPNETTGQALLRLRLISLGTLIDGTVGGAKVGPLPIRPVSDRLGECLIRDGLLQRRQLKSALFLQTQVRKPLGELLVEAHFASSAAVSRAINRQSAVNRFLPAADNLGELLIASKFLSRTQLLNIIGEIERLGTFDLLSFLRERGLVPLADLDDFVAWRERKIALIGQGTQRLGEVLVSQRATTTEAIGEALMAQVDDPKPLGHLLVEGGRITPEQLVTAIEEQDRRRNRLALGVTRDEGRKREVLNEKRGPPKPSRRQRQRLRISLRFAAVAAVCAFLGTIAVGLLVGRVAAERRFENSVPAATFR